MLIKKSYDVVGILNLLERTKTHYKTECQKCGRISFKSIKEIGRINREGTAGCYCSRRRKANPESPTNHPGIGTWNGMMRRCYNPDHIAYHRYGGRGITVCDEWKNNKREFLNWLDSNNWKSGLHLDRINNNEGYSPENCRLVSSKENQNNKSTNHFIFVRGERLTVSDAARLFKIGKSALRERLRRGWSEEDAATIPVKVYAARQSA